MASTLTVWVRMKDVGLTADQISKSQPSALPLILRKRSSVASEDEDFTFPYSPREMNINQLADEMVQIPRPGTTPIVAFKSHRLMTLDFTALIVHPGDGLFNHVEKEIAVLRSFASSSDKVFQLLNYDNFTRTPYIFRNMSEEKISGLFFSITDMDIEVTRRNKQNLITSANVKISLVENRNPKINLALIPPLKLIKRPENCKVPAYAKAHPAICNPDKQDPRRQFSDSEVINANQLFSIQYGYAINPNNSKNFKLCRLGKIVRWMPLSFKPCLG